MRHSYYSEKHRDLIDEAVSYGLSIGLKTERSDREAAERAISQLYASCGCPPPENILWFKSPYASVKALAAEHDKARWGYHTGTWRNVVGDFETLKASAIPQRDPRIPDDIRKIKLDLSTRIDTEVWYWVGSELSKNVRERTRVPVNAVASHIGAHFNARHAAEIFALERLGVQVSPRLKHFRLVTELMWWWHPGESVVFASEPPTVLHLDSEPRQPMLHHPAEKALQFDDGTGFSSWHGHIIPDRWVSGSPPTPEQAVARSNDTERAIACEIIGWERVFDALSATKVDAILAPSPVTLWEVQIAETERQRFLDFVDWRGTRSLLPVAAHVSSVAEAKASLGIA